LVKIIREMLVFWRLHGVYGVHLGTPLAHVPHKVS